VQLALPLRPAREELRAAVAELALQFRRKSDCLRREDLGVLGGDAARDLDAGAVLGRAHRVLARGFARGARPRAPRPGGPATIRDSKLREILPDPRPAEDRGARQASL